MPGVDVARALCGRQRVDRSRLVGGHSHGPAEGCERNVDVIAELRGGAVAQVEIADVGVGEVGGEQTETGKDRAPAPGPRLELQDLDLECVARLSAADVDRPAQRVEAVEVERPELRGRVALLQLSGRDLFGVEVDHVSGVDLHGRRKRVVPLEVELVPPDAVLFDPRPDAHFRAASCTPSLIGAAPARRTFLSNLPTEVLGTSSMNRTSSGSHHLATLSLRNSFTSSSVTWPLNSGRGTA